MKRLGLVFTIFIGVTGVLRADPAAQKILAEAEKILYPDSFYLRNTLTTTGPGKSGQAMSFEVYHKKDVGSVMEIAAPARSRGIRFLEKSGGLWMYNPKAQSGNAIRLSPRSAFQGSVFSNNDVSDPKYSDDYDTVVAGTETLSHPELGEISCLVLECTAKTEQSPYARIRIWLRATDNLPLRMDYYARSGLLFKRMTLSGIKLLAGRPRPSVITMESFELPGTISTITFDKMTVRNDLPDSRFTEAALTR